MLNWLRTRWRSRELPHYSRLRSVPSRGLPHELEEQENSEAFGARRGVLERELLELERRPTDDKPLLTQLLVEAFKNELEGFSVPRGVVTIPFPEGGGQCLPVFTTPLRAADYVRTLLPSGRGVQYLTSSPAQFLHMLPGLETAGVKAITVDRCPRCSTFNTIAFSPTADAATVVELWGVHKATELARAELYFDFASRSARAGRLEMARDVALEAVGHVTFEDPRLHLLLGQIAVSLGDRTLLREARAFLRFFELARWERKLDEIQRSDSPDFTCPE